MDLETVKKIGLELDTILRLRTPTLGVKFCTKDTKLNMDDYSIIDHPMAMCSIFGISRYFEIPVYVAKETIYEKQRGTEDISIFGKKVSKEKKKEMAKSFVGLFTESEHGDAIFPEVTIDNIDVTGIALFPLKCAPIMPDVVQIWGNALQRSFMVYAHVWTQPNVKLTNGSGTNGHGGSIYEGAVVPFVEQRINMVTLDMGDRKHGLADDSEDMIAMPICELERMHYGAVEVQKTRHCLPVLYDFESSEFPVNPKFLKRKDPKIF